MKTFLAALLLAVVQAGAATLPNRINFQGKLLDPATNAPKDGAFSIAFRIYDGSGNSLWGPETHPAVSVVNGVFSVQLGSVLALPPQVFSNGDTHLGITVGADSEMTPRQQLVMAPYAFTAAQLAHSSDLRLNAGLAYSTFTSAGNLLVQHGVSASTVTASSNVVVTGGMLSVTSPSGVHVEFGVIAATASFTSTTAPSVYASSNIVIDNRGMLDVRGTGGVSVAYGVLSATSTVLQYAEHRGVAGNPAGATGAARTGYNTTTDDFVVNVADRGATALGRGSVTMWNTDATGGVTNQGLNLPAALTEFDSAVQGTRMVVDCEELAAQLGVRYHFRALAATNLTVVISVRDVTNTANVLATVSRNTAAIGNYPGLGTFSAKPAWCTGQQTVAVYTSGGNGAADYIFRYIQLLQKP